MRSFFAFELQQLLRNNVVAPLSFHVLSHLFFCSTHSVLHLRQRLYCTALCMFLVALDPVALVMYYKRLHLIDIHSSFTRYYHVLHSPSLIRICKRLASFSQLALRHADQGYITRDAFA